MILELNDYSKVTDYLERQFLEKTHKWRNQNEKQIRSNRQGSY